MHAAEFLSLVEGVVAAGRQAKAMYAEQLAPDFTPFDFLDSHETALSRVLAWMLDPQGSHAQGARFLEEFLRWLDVDDLGGLHDWSGARVQTEVPATYSKDGGFIDILVTAGGCGLAIENKPYAGDQVLQVTRYLNDLAHRSPRAHCLVYLSGAGGGPSEVSITEQEASLAEEAGRLSVRSYADLTAWLELSARSCRAPSVSALIRGLAAFVQKEIVGVTNRSEAAALADTILSNPGRLNAALALFEAQAATREKLIARLVADVEERVSKKKGWNIARSDIGAKIHTGLLIGLPSTKARFGIQFDQNGYRYLFYGAQVDGGGKLEPRVRKAVDGCLGPGKSTEYWPWWRQVSANDRFFPIAPSLDREFWLMANDGRLASMLVEFVEAIESAIKRA